MEGGRALKRARARWRRRATAALVGVVLGLGLGGCFHAQDERPGPPPAPPVETRVEGTGTVVFVELEGGFYGIVADDGARYEPLNLPAEFQQDGLRVRFRARVLKDVASVHMWGRPVELLQIEALEGPRL